MADSSNEKEFKPGGHGDDPEWSSKDGGARDDDSKNITTADEKGFEAREKVAVASSSGQLLRTKSSATDASATSAAASGPGLRQEPKPWYKKLNPLRWGGIPPVPAERTVSREYKAGFFSVLTFQWMAPLMNVSGMDRRV